MLSQNPTCFQAGDNTPLNQLGQCLIQISIKNIS